MTASARNPKRGRKRFKHLGPRGGVYYMSGGRRIYPGRKKKVRWGKTAKRR